MSYVDEMTDAEDEYAYRLAWEKAHTAAQERVEVAETLIRELVAALDRIAKGAMYIEDFTASTSAVIWAKFALAKAKAAGYEPTPTLGKGFPGNEP